MPGIFFDLKTARVPAIPAFVHTFVPPIMKNKKFILFLIVLFPSAFWLTLELSTINSSRLPFYGPKTVKAPKDTVFYTVNQQGMDATLLNDTVNFPVYVICFLKPQDEKDSYKMSGMVEYLKYKQESIQHMPIFWAATCTDTAGNMACKPEVKKQLGLVNPNVYELSYDPARYDALVKQNYFKDKPYYVDYSFLVLVDKHRHIRGYYDGRYVAEVKRLLEEYKHLRLKEEQKKILNTNAIESK